MCLWLLSVMWLLLAIQALTDPVAENSVYTIPAVDILAPVLSTILFDAQDKAMAASTIHNAERFIGQYYGGWRVWLAAPSVLQASFGGSTLNLTASGFDEAVFKAVPGTVAGREIGCRWLDDGVDEELAYFEFSKGPPGTPEHTHVMRSDNLSTAVSFMGSKWDRLHA